jgi:hypothetical protein
MDTLRVEVVWLLMAGVRGVVELLLVATPPGADCCCSHLRVMTVQDRERLVASGIRR